MPSAARTSSLADRHVHASILAEAQGRSAHLAGAHRTTPRWASLLQPRKLRSRRASTRQVDHRVRSRIDGCSSREEFIPIQAHLRLPPPALRRSAKHIRSSAMFPPGGSTTIRGLRPEGRVRVDQRAMAAEHRSTAVLRLLNHVNIQLQDLSQVGSRKDRRLRDRDRRMAMRGVHSDLEQVQEMRLHKLRRRDAILSRRCTKPAMARRRGASISVCRRRTRGEHRGNHRTYSTTRL